MRMWLLTVLLLACKDKAQGDDTGAPPGDDTGGGGSVEDCDDDVDNDADGLADCADPDCFGEACREDCDDGGDNDADGLTDCLDDDCASTSFCYEDCQDGEDDDGDGLADCADPDCMAACDEDCADGVDNDADGLVDCEDDECVDACVEDCANGVDDDGDGALDCADPDCTTACDEDCADGVDNDADGLVDCEDDECVDLCIEDCTNGADDDGDGDEDCEDDECFGADGCGGPYDLVLTAALDEIAWGWGDGLYAGYGAWAYARLEGPITVAAHPSGWSGDAFTCNGRVDGLSGPDGFGGLDYYATHTTVDYIFAWEPTTANAGLTWYDACPLEGLPTALLGFIGNRPTVWRLSSTGVWCPAYYAVGFSVVTGTDYKVDVFTEPEQASPVYWSGVY